MNTCLKLLLLPLLAGPGPAFAQSPGAPLLKRFTKPEPAAGGFANPLVAVGSDRVLIGGVENRNSGLPNPGAVYLFNTNGTLLRGSGTDSGQLNLRHLRHLRILLPFPSSPLCSLSA